jgi:hypothetical protein
MVLVNWQAFRSLRLDICLWPHREWFYQSLPTQPWPLLNVIF